MPAPSTTVLAVSYFFHLMATVVWIGGLVTLTILVLPTVRMALADQPVLGNLLAQLRRRFLPLSNFSLALLIVTGMLQMSGDPNYDGVLQFSNEWSRVILLKHVAIGGMILCGLLMQYAIVPALERARLLVERGKGDALEQARLQRNETRLTWINLALGVLVLAFSAWATAL